MQALDVLQDGHDRDSNIIPPPAIAALMIQGAPLANLRGRVAVYAQEKAVEGRYVPIAGVHGHPQYGLVRATLVQQVAMDGRQADFMEPIRELQTGALEYLLKVARETPCSAATLLSFKYGSS
jgi:hypothetical protein